MYISNLTIKNYRNFLDFEINLHPFTVIIGENNSGKTNLLNALGLIFSSEIAFFKKRVLEIDDVNYKSIYNFKKAIAELSIPPEKIEFPEVKIEVTMKDFNPDQEAVVADWFTDPDLKESKLTYVFANRDPKKNDWIEKKRQIVEKIQENEAESSADFLQTKIDMIDFPIKSYDYIIYGGLDGSKQVDGYFLRMLKMEYLDALRDARRELVASGDYRLLYKILNNRDEEKYADIKQELNFFDQAIKKSAELENIRSDIEKYLDKISLYGDSESNCINFQFSSIEISELLKKLSLIYGNDPVNVERNGMGRNNLLYISLIISHIYTKSLQNDNVFFKLIGIEEPESHLHPHLQEHMGKNFQSEVDDSKQLILTSHSTHITSKLDLENLVVLYKDSTGDIQNHYVLSNFGKTAEEQKTIRYLKKYLDATNSTLFFSRKIMLVEGIAEKLLIPVFFQKIYGKTIEKVRCNVINVNGLAFKNYLEIIKNGYFVKCIVLTDSDTDTKIENRADNLRDRYSSCPFINIESTEESTFEKDLIKFNSNGSVKETLIRALEATRPDIGKEFRRCLGDPDIDIKFFSQYFFEKIKNYKSEFAYNLAEILSDGSEVEFNIPPYIQNSFIFLMGEL